MNRLGQSRAGTSSIRIERTLDDAARTVPIPVTLASLDGEGADEIPFERAEVHVTIRG